MRDKMCWTEPSSSRLGGGTTPLWSLYGVAECGGSDIEVRRFERVGREVLNRVRIRGWVQSQSSPKASSIRAMGTGNLYARRPGAFEDGMEEPLGHGGALGRMRPIR